MQSTQSEQKTQSEAPERITVWLSDNWLQRIYHTPDEMEEEPENYRGGVDFTRADRRLSPETVEALRTWSGAYDKGTEQQKQQPRWWSEFAMSADEVIRTILKELGA